MDWTLITTIASVLFGSTSVLGGIAFYAQNKRLKETEVKEREEELSVKRVAALHTALDTLNEQLKESYRNGERKEEIIEDKTAKIRELQEQLLAAISEANEKDVEQLNEIYHLKAENQWLRLWHCARPSLDCGRRLPPHPFPVDYVLPPGVSPVVQVQPELKGQKTPNG